MLSASAADNAQFVVSIITEFDRPTGPLFTYDGSGPSSDSLDSARNELRRMLVDQIDLQGRRSRGSCIVNAVDYAAEYLQSLQGTKVLLVIGDMLEDCQNSVLGDVALERDYAEAQRAIAAVVPRFALRDVRVTVVLRPPATRVFPSLRVEEFWREVFSRYETGNDVAFPAEFLTLLPERLF